jgi:hypothetical protein
MAYIKSSSQGDILAGISRDLAVSPKNLTDNVWFFSGNTVNTIKNIGTKTNYDIPFIRNDVEKMRVTSGGLSIGTTVESTGTTKLLVDSGIIHASGIKFSQLTSDSPNITGGAIGVDVNGNIVKISNGEIFSFYVSGNTGTPVLITSGNTLTIAAGFGLSGITSHTDTLTLALNANLDALTDVNTAGALDGQFLSWSSGSSNWIPSTVSVPISGATNGLQVISGNVGLGGTLTNGTTVTLGANDLNFDTNSTGKIGVDSATPVSGLDVNTSVSCGAIKTVTGTTTLTDADYMLMVDNSTTTTINLPSAASAIRREYVIKKISTEPATITIDPDNSELIDGATSYTISSSYVSIKIKSNGTNWYIF